MRRIIKRISIVLLIIVVVLIGSLKIYTINSSEPLDEMYQAIDSMNTSNLTVEDKFDHISYQVESPKKNIVIIPGGKVEPKSYEYLAIRLANAGYDVTIVKTLFNLAILTPNYGSKFLSNDIDNVVIGHSLGGTVASMFSSGDDRVTDVIFLASYAIKDLKDKHVLTITGENDLVLDNEKLEEAKTYLPDDATFIEIPGANHAQFGWYGEQKGDGEATISTNTQQNAVIVLVLAFIL